jgi:hypothetical protein
VVTGNTELNLGVSSVDRLLADTTRKAGEFAADPDDVLLRCELAEVVRTLSEVAGKMEALAHRLLGTLQAAGSKV